MKQFQYTKPSGRSYNPFDFKDACLRTACASPLEALKVGATWADRDGDVWTRLPDLMLQDDVPLTAEDVTECRESAIRVRYKLRLERLATAALQGLLASPNTARATAYTSLAEEAVTTAKALIAELDKQS